MRRVVFDTVAIMLVSAMLVSAVSLAAAQNSTNISVPAWVKKNAKWWSEGSVGDKDFVQGIQYLIQKGIMKIPQTKSSDSKSEEKIPAWIKSNAGWWADGKISDGDFVSGIQYLISKGIMKVSPPPTPTKKDSGGY